MANTGSLVGPFPVVGAIGDIHDEARNPLGAIAYDQNGNRYKYLKGVASTVDGSWVTYDEAGLTLLAVANAQGGLAVAQAATVASTWGWYCIEGTVSALCLASFVDNGKVYLTSTDGSVDDTDVSADFCVGVIGRSARDTTTGMATFQLIGTPLVQDTIFD